MAFWDNDILKKLRENNSFISLKEVLKSDYTELKENMIHGQQLANMGSYTYDIQNDETFVSDGIYNILGCTPQDLDGENQSYYMYIHPDDKEIVRAANLGAVEGKPYDIEYRIIRSDGQERYVNEKTKVLYDENGNPIKVVGVIEDITNYKLIENNLKEIDDNLNQGLRISGVGSWKYDMINDKFFASDEVYRIFAITPLDYKNGIKNIVNLIHPEDQAKFYDSIEKTLSGKSCRAEFRIPQPDGTSKFVIVKEEPLFDNEHQIVGIIGTVQDITYSKLLEQELERSHKTLAEAQKLAHIGSWEMDIILNRCYWSEETYRILGASHDQFDGTFEGFLKFVHPDDKKIIQDYMKNPPHGQHFEMEFHIIRPDGTIRNIYDLVKFTFDKDGKPSFIHGIIQDITEKKRFQRIIVDKQQEITKIQRKFQVLIQESNDVFEIITPDGAIQYISPAIERVLGYKPEEILGRKAFEFMDDNEKLKLAGMLELALKNPYEHIKGDIILRTRSGNEIYVAGTICNLLSDPSIQGIVLNYRDITKRVEIEKKIAYIASHDELTGLPNRTYFKEHLKMACQHAKENQSKFALMILDLTGFKYINDVLGYQLVDQLVVEIVKRLTAFLGDKKLICRYSAVQFAIITEGLSTIEEYKNLAKEIINLFSRAFKIQMYELDVVANIGVSIYPDDASDIESLIKCASIALHWAKKKGKNTYKFYSSDINIQSYKEFQLRQDLRKAIEMGQLKIYYQPIVNLKTNDILASEVLIRWEHPDWGIVQPDEFINIAEETGYIIEIGKWILREVCRSYKMWMDNGMPAIKVSVNFSSIQFFENNFVENIAATIAEFGLDPHFLIIEITESILMKETDKVISDIKKLQSLGIQVALDDFGTGFSSLQYLHSFNIDILKIDGSFVKNILHEKTSAIITRYIINMSRELKIKLVAEGIENPNQLNCLIGLSCHTGQGYLYSRPVPLKAFEKILSNGKCKPIMISGSKTKLHEQRRKYFRINFYQLLEADMTILEIRGRRLNVGNTKVLIRDIGPGGLCFISNVRLPVQKDFILQFTTQLLGKELKVFGHVVWGDEMDDKLYAYGIEFIFDENDRSYLIRDLNQVQIKMKNNILSVNGRFVSGSPVLYFKSQNN